MERGGAADLAAKVADRKRRGEWAEAEALLRAGLAERPDDDFLRASFADLLMRRGEADEAVALAEDILRVRPGYGPALVAKGMALHRLGRFADADAALAAAWAAHPTPFVGLQLARSRARSAGPAPALEFVRQALAHTDDPRLRKEEALLLQHLGHAEQAAEVYGEVAQGAPDDAFAYAGMLRGRLAGRPPDEALAELDRVLRLPARADDPHLRGLRADLLAAAGRPGEAAAEWEGIVARRPGDAYARSRLAFAYRRAGRAADAFPVLQAVVRADPADMPALSALVADARVLGRQDEVRGLLMDLLQRHPGRRNLWGYVRRLQGPAGPADRTRGAARAAGARVPKARKGGNAPTP